MKIDSLNIRNIKLLMDRYGYYFYLIKRVPGTTCSCVNRTTKDPDANCKKCLGLGSKIKIFKVYGMIRETNDYEASIAQNISSTPKVVYLLGMVRVNKDDIVIDNEDIYHVLHIQHHKGEHGEFAFTRLTCPFIKGNDTIIIKNFKELYNEYHNKKKRP